MLVIGGTGTVGTQVVRALTDKGAKVRVMTRTLGAHSGAEYVAGSLESPETLGSAFDRVSKVYLLTPLVENETELGMNAVRAAQESGVRHIVFHSAHHAADAPQVPHFKTKLEIIEGLRSSGIPYTVLSPNNFFQNDLDLQEPITRYGVYAAPIGGVGCSRVDVRDIGDAAAVTLLEDGHEGRDYALVGPRGLRGRLDPASRPGGGLRRRRSGCLVRGRELHDAGVAGTRPLHHVRLLPGARPEGERGGGGGADAASRPPAPLVRGVRGGDRSGLGVAEIAPGWA